MRSGFWFWILLVLHCVFWLVFLRHLPFFRSPVYFLDFDTYLQLWREIFQGVNPYAVGHMFTLGPPLVLIPYLPFALLPPVLAQFLFFILNVFAGYLLCQRLALRFALSLSGWLVLSLLLFVSFPVRFSLLMGQPALIVAYLLTELLLGHKRLPIYALIILKTFFLFLLIPAAKSKRLIIQILFYLGATIFAFSPLLLPSWYGYYAEHVLAPAVGSIPVSTDLDYYNQSLKSTLGRFRVEGMAIVAVGILGLVLMFKSWRSGSIELGIISSVLLSPVIWQHYLVFGLPLIFYLWFQKGRGRDKLLLVISGLLISVNFSFLQNAKPTLVTGLLASHGFIGLCLLLWLVWQTKGTRLPQIRLKGSPS